MEPLDQRSDAVLLHDTTDAASAFATVYRRHVGAVLRFFARERVPASDAADLTAETFAAALLSRHRFEARQGSAEPWLLGIARHKLGDSRRRYVREDRARRRLGMERVPFTAIDDAEYASIGDDHSSEILAALDELPAAQREAVTRRVVAGESYAHIGRASGVNQAAARQRVSRGLAALRKRLGEES